jgi:euchromatic histone-lysine N-methyltransferase
MCWCSGVTSIIESGGYEDDEDTGDVLWYTGQGANDLQGDHKQVDNQKLVRVPTGC